MDYIKNILFKRKITPILNYLVLIFAITLVVSFFIRAWERQIFLYAAAILAIYYLITIKIRNPSISLISKSIIGLLLLFGLIFSLNYDRVASWDGQLWYMTRVLNLQNNVPLNILNTAYPPYLAELFLSFVLKVSNLNFVSVAIYLSAVLNIVLAFKFYDETGYTKHTKILTLILVLSPNFLRFMIIEFKMEHFLLNAALLSFIYYYKNEKSPTLLKSVLLGLFSAAAILIKVSVLPFYTLLIFFSLVKHLYNKNYLHLRYYLVSGAVTLTLSSIWTIIFGVSIPWTNINYYPHSNQPSVIFEKDINTYLQCLKQAKDVDFSLFLYSTDLKKVVLQPLYYLFDGRFIKFTMGLNAIEPGLLIYFSIITFIPLVFIIRKYHKDVLLITAVLYLLYYYISIQGLFWYLFFLYPVFLIPLFNRLLSQPYYKHIYKFLTLAISIMYLLLLLERMDGFIRSNMRFEKPDVDNVALSTVLNKTNGLILDTSPHPSQLFLTFVNNYDERVVKDPWYFGYTNKNDEEVRKELIENKIKYIAILTKQNLNNNEVYYYGCPQKSISRVIEFTAKYGKPIYINEKSGAAAYRLE